ncbi:phage tail tape measure protein [Pectobacterium parmentieri]|uniref:phage tail tape measure protein n=1 Tax=Pectobacterium parmentieri TaxID=1905730 RepID=UPI001374227B|nr:phage tail tape measure protein [Pectobacterium parmentieri]QHQ16542.1 phage tail tape measure protein [Pectobacterium parmentieri]
MATEFSIGVIIGGAISGAFRSAVTGTRRTLDGMSESTRRLQERQAALTRAMERYGNIGSRASQRLNADLQRVGRTLEQLQRQQNRLAAASAMSDAARANRMALYAKGAETYAIARTVAAPVMGSIKQYASFESGLRDIAVTGDLDKTQEQAIGTAIRHAALKVNQTQEALLGGVGQLVADGMNPVEAAKFAGMLGKTATATKGDMTELAKMTYAFSSALQITDPKEMEEAFSIAATGAKLGSFELKDMAKALPGLAKSFAAKGIVGKDAITQIVASLEVAKGSGSAEEAVTNMTNWLAAMNRSDTIQKYEKAGINYKASMQDYVAKGFSQYEASLMIANRFIDGKGKAFAEQWQKAGARGDKETQQKLFESFGMAEIFTDIQTAQHLISMRQDWGKYQSNKTEMNSPESQQTLDKDAGKQNETLEARWRQTQIRMNEAAIGIGESLKPVLISLGETIIPLIDQAGKWIAANPEIVKGVVMAAAGLLAFKAAAIGTKLGLNLLLSPIVDLWKGAALLRSKWLLLRLSFGTGGRARQWINWFGNLSRGAGNLARSLGGALLRGITLVGRAVMIMGRALLMNPIGLLVTGIAVAAYLVYRYWEPISNWFRARWNDIKTAFSGGIGGVTKLILNWSPIGIFYTVFAEVMKYFGIDMPSKFTDFGANIISGLVNGIRNAWEGAKKVVGELGDNIKGWFAEKLGIHSPSRVFASFGDNISQGAAIGISRTTPLAAKAGQRLAGALTPDVPDIPIPLLNADGSVRRGSANSSTPNGASNGIHVTFSPNIYLNGQKTPATPEITSALNLSLHELEKMMERIVAQQQRRGYA